VITGLLQGLAVIGAIVWALVAAVLLAACEPRQFDAPISRFYPWWCLVWPLVLVAFLGAMLLDLVSCPTCGRPCSSGVCRRCEAELERFRRGPEP
jgi:hypothetical protein